MIWPVGQPDGQLFERALVSLHTWQEILTEAKLWHEQQGALHVVYNDDEWQVLQELYQLYRHRGYHLLGPAEVQEKSAAVKMAGLKGGLFSPHEMIVEARVSIGVIASYLQEKYGVIFSWGEAVTGIEHPALFTATKKYTADEIFVCSGADFAGLYPALFESLEITTCKLQMMRTEPQPGGWRMQAPICGALSLLHYKSFAIAPSLDMLRKNLAEKYPEYIRYGIHVMACQNQAGEITIGDSHEYGSVHEPFDKQSINQLILTYLDSFTELPQRKISESWNGCYAKMTNGDTELVRKPDSGVTIINGLGGAGMTLSFGLAEEVVSKL